MEGGESRTAGSEERPAQPTPPRFPEMGYTATGRKKHKCTVCGNFARSRCPFHSCKSCCSKARNPCLIHVLKTAASPGQTNVPAGGKQEREQPTGSSNAHSTSFTQSPQALRLMPAQRFYDGIRLRTLKHPGFISFKEAQFVNAWRFQRLRECREAQIANEDEAFDRYMESVSKLEEIFSVRTESLDCLLAGDEVLLAPSLGKDEHEVLTAAFRTRLRMNSKRKEASKHKLRRTIERSLQRLRRGGGGDDDNEALELDGGPMGAVSYSALRGMKRIRVQSKLGKERLKRLDAFNSLFQKLKNVGDKDDLSSCIKLYKEHFLRNNLTKKDTQSSHFESLGLAMEKLEELMIRRQSLPLSPKKSDEPNNDHSGIVKACYRRVEDDVEAQSFSSILSL